MTGRLKINPNNAEAYNNRGNVKKDLQDWAGALADYNQALEINPRYAYACNNRGIVEQATGAMGRAPLPIIPWR